MESIIEQLATTSKAKKEWKARAVQRMDEMDEVSLVGYSDDALAREKTDKGRSTSAGNCTATVNQVDSTNENEGAPQPRRMTRAAVRAHPGDPIEFESMRTAYPGGQSWDPVLKRFVPTMPSVAPAAIVVVLVQPEPAPAEPDIEQGAADDENEVDDDPDYDPSRKPDDEDFDPNDDYEQESAYDDDLVRIFGEVVEAAKQISPCSSNDEDRADLYADGENEGVEGCSNDEDDDPNYDEGVVSYDVDLIPWRGTGDKKPPALDEKEEGSSTVKFGTDDPSAAAMKRLCSPPGCKNSINCQHKNGDVNKDSFGADDKMECACCYHEVPKAKIVACRDGGHSFCEECISKQLNVKIFYNFSFGVVTATGEQSSDLMCFHVGGCQSRFRTMDLEKFLSPQILEKFKDLQLKRSCEDKGLLGDLCSCPKSRLRAELSSDFVVFSSGPCEEVVQNNLENECRRREEEAMTNAIVRECPVCKVSIIKSDDDGGCNMMTCPCQTNKAKIRMCYICHNQVPHRNSYEHFCAQTTCPHTKGECCRLTTTKEEDNERDEQAIHKARLAAVQKYNDEVKEDACRRKVEEAMTKAIVRECPGCKNIVTKSECRNLMICPCNVRMCYLCCEIVDRRKIEHFCIETLCPHKKGDCCRYTFTAEEEHQHNEQARHEARLAAIKAFEEELKEKASRLD